MGARPRVSVTDSARGAAHPQCSDQSRTRDAGRNQRTARRPPKSAHLLHVPQDALLLLRRATQHVQSVRARHLRPLRDQNAHSERDVRQSTYLHALAHALTPRPAATQVGARDQTSDGHTALSDGQIAAEGRGSGGRGPQEEVPSGARVQRLQAIGAPSDRHGERHVLVFTNGDRRPTAF